MLEKVSARALRPLAPGGPGELWIGMNAEQHRLAAILFADIVGYSRMPQAHALQCRSRMLESVHGLLPSARGRLVKSQGDDILAEFSSANDALGFALALQDRVADENSGRAPGQQFRLRIGIHAGEIVPEGEDVLGDTVNLAKRTQSLAAPGGVCLTESVWQQVVEQLPRPARRLGRIPVKHIKLPLVFCHLDPPGAGWSYRVGHRLRLGLGHPAGLALPLLLCLLALWGLVLIGQSAGRWLPTDPVKLLEKAQLYLDRYDKAGFVQKSIDALARIPADAPQFPDSRAWLGLAEWRRYLDTGDLEARTDAFNASSAAISRNAEIPLAHFVQGLIAKDKGSLIAASNYFSRANVLEGEENGLVLIELANVCRLLHEPAVAADYLAKAAGVRNKSWPFYNELAKYEFVLGHYDSALTNCLRAAALAPHNSLVEGNLAGLYLSLPDFSQHLQDAWNCLERSRASRTTAFYYFSLGQYHLVRHEWAAAIASFHAAVDLRPKDYRFWGNAGIALKRAGKIEESTEFLTKAIAKASAALPDINNCVIAAHIGLYQAALGHPAEALRQFEIALEQCPANSQVLSAAQSAQQELAARKEAAALQRLIDKMPHNN